MTRASPAGFTLTFDAADPSRLAEFWAVALGYQIEPPPEGFTSWSEALTAWQIPPDQWDNASAIIDPTGALPRIFIQKVPEPKSAKNRLHIDVRSWSGAEAPPVDERRGLVERKAKELVAAGASVVGSVQEHDSYWMVMLDPEGNEFCVT
ncbi:MAG: VOC family protein [Jiangellaceae bacterium]